MTSEVVENTGESSFGEAQVRKCGIYSILCTTREAELRFRFSYLQFLGLYSKSPKLAFNQWVAGSSPARLIYKYKEVNYLWAVSNGRPIHCRVGEGPSAPAGISLAVSAVSSFVPV